METLLVAGMLVPTSALAQHGGAGASARVDVRAQVLETRAVVGVSRIEVAAHDGDPTSALRLHLPGNAAYRLIARRASASDTEADRLPRLWLRIEGEPEQELEPGGTRIVGRSGGAVDRRVAEVHYRIETTEGTAAPAGIRDDVVLQLIIEPAT